MYDNEHSCEARVLDMMDYFPSLTPYVELFYPGIDGSCLSGGRI